MTIEELENKPIDQLTDDEAKLLVDHYKQLSAKYTAYEQAVKLTLNSIYGAFGNKWFHFFNMTLLSQLQNRAKMLFSIQKSILNKYVNDFGIKTLQFTNNSVLK